MAKVKYCSRGLQIDKTKVEKASVGALVDFNIGSIVRDLQMLIKATKRVRKEHWLGEYSQSCYADYG